MIRVLSFSNNSYLLIFSFDRNGQCEFGDNAKEIVYKQTQKLKPNWIDNFVTNKNDKTQGQYFFSDETIQVVLNNLSPKNSVLLVGCPSLLAGILIN